MPHDSVTIQTEDFSVSLDQREHVPQPRALALVRASGGARVLVVTSDKARGHAIHAWLLRTGASECWMLHDRHEAIAAAREHQPEIAIVELGFEVCSGPAVALQVAAAALRLETVFFADARDLGEIAAARDLGLARIFLYDDDLYAHLERLLHPLAESVRLRRRLEGVEAHIRRLGAEPAGRGALPRVTLPEAERRYRETYVRWLLTETGSRREAARQAGVPYTTLCEIMRKLGISGENE